MKLCKDCRNYIKSDVMDTYDMCFVVKSPVTGKPSTYCSRERIDLLSASGCGAEGKLFAPKAVLVAPPSVREPLPPEPKGGFLVHVIDKVIRTLFRL